jgi:hypothetical protein
MSHLVAIAYDDLDTAQQVVANIGRPRPRTRSSWKTSSSSSAGETARSSFISPRSRVPVRPGVRCGAA